MARPRIRTQYATEDGIIHQRLICFIEGCNRIRMLMPKYRPDGSKYYWEHRTCNSHRVDGGTFHCHSDIQQREQRWKGYGLHYTVREYDLLLKLQGGVCALCGKEPQDGRRRFDVDHDHKTGEVRGILCAKCNTTIGWVEKMIPLNKLKLYFERGGDKEVTSG